MNTTTRDDLDYLRDLAEAGDNAPLLSGRFLAWWGAVITIAYGLHYSIASGLTGLSADAIGIMWAIVMVIALGGYFTLGAFFPAGKPGHGSAGNRADIVWLAGGMSIFAFFAGTIPAVVSGSLPPTIMNHSIPLVFSVYACGLLVTGTLAGNTIMKAAAVIALIFVAVTSFLAGGNTVYLAAGVGVFLTVFLPGLSLLRAEPRTTV